MSNRSSLTRCDLSVTMWSVDIGKATGQVAFGVMTSEGHSVDSVVTSERYSVAGDVGKTTGQFTVSVMTSDGHSVVTRCRQDNGSGCC